MNNIIDFREIELPVVYGSEGRASVFDYIAYIRKIYPNPWECCFFIESEHFMDNKLLNKYNLKSVSEEELEQLKNEEKFVVHILDQVFFVITYDMLKLDENDYGISDLVHNFMMKYSVSQVQVLLYMQMEDGSNVIEILSDLRKKYPNGYIQDTQQLILPYFAYTLFKNNEEATNTLDISEYIDEIVLMHSNQTLTLQKLEEFESYIVEAIKKNNKINSIVYFGGGGNIVLRSLISYLAIKYGISYGISEDSQYNWIAECEFTYAYNRMSLYERLKFVSNLPVAMLYRPNIVLAVDCRYEGYSAPEIVAVYDYETCEKIDSNLSLTDISIEDAIDFRSLFKEQRAVASSIMQPSDYKKYLDYETDLNLISKFIEMDISENINIRNSLLYRDKVSGRTLLIYTSGDFVLDTRVAAKNIFNVAPFKIEEKNFNKLFSHPQMSKLFGNVPIIMDIKSILILNIFSNRPLYLSYYELALRWVSSLEDNVYDGEVVDLFSYIPLENIRKEPNAKYFITSFGKPLSFDKNIKENIKLRLTNKIMSGKVLPR